MPVIWVAWTVTDIATLRQMAGEGATAKAIGVVVGKTRNAVIGKAQRLGVVLEKINGWQNGVVSERRKPKPVKFVASPETNQPLVAETMPGPGVPFFEVTFGQCRWINGEVNHRHTKFCGAQVLIGTSWCTEHAKIVFTRHKSPGTWSGRQSTRY